MRPVSGTPSRRVLRCPFRPVDLAVGGRAGLAALAGPLAFFTPALLYLRGRFSDAQVEDFLAEHGGDVVFYRRSFSRPVFAGLEGPGGDPHWNHTLWALRSEHWDAFESYALSVKLLDTPRRRMYGVGAQRLSVLDPLFLDRVAVVPEGVPLLPLVAFGVSGNASAWALRFDPDRPWLTPSAVRLPPDPGAAAFAEDVFRERNPYDRAQPDPAADAAARALAAGHPGRLGPFRARPATGADEARVGRLLRRAAVESPPLPPPPP